MSTSDAAGVPAINPSGAPPSALSGDPFQTDLIIQLMKEAVAGSSTVGPSPSGLPASLPTGLPSGSLPTSLLPSASIPGLQTGRLDESGLAGGYPRATTQTHPPVHPLLSPTHPPSQRSAFNSRPLSGGHDPEGSEAYAFGEPRCNGNAFSGVPNRALSPGDKHANSDVHSRGALPTPASFDSSSIGAEPEFYFLRGPSPKPLPASAVHPSTVASSPSLLDIDSIRRDFPALNQKVHGKPLVWLDNAATTHKPKRVIDATSEFYGRHNSNIHRAAHALAARSTELFENGREKVREFLGAASAQEIIFVRGTTEAINLVAQSYGRQQIKSRDEILLTGLEHHANIVPWQLLSQQTGAVIRVIPLNDRGELNLEEFPRLLNQRTRIVSVAHVSNALGTVNPVEHIIAMAHAQGVPVLVDGAQSTPHLPVNVQALDADFFAFSGHKVFGPTGIGALYGKAALLEQMPPWQGGGHMIRDVTFEKTVYQSAPEKFEAGTPDIAGVVGLAAAIDYLFDLGIPAIAAYEHQLLEYATEQLHSIPGLRLIGTALNKASVLSFVIPGKTPQNIARHLDQHGIAVRAGHHCAQPAVRHFGLEATVRASLAFYNNHADVEALVSALRRL